MSLQETKHVCAPLRHDITRPHPIPREVLRLELGELVTIVRAVRCVRERRGEVKAREHTKLVVPKKEEPLRLGEEIKHSDRIRPAVEEISHREQGVVRAKVQTLQHLCQLIRTPVDVA